MSTDKRILTDIPLIHSNESSHPKQNTFNIDKVVSISFNRKKRLKVVLKLEGPIMLHESQTVASRRLKSVFKTFTLVRFSFDRAGEIFRPLDRSNKTFEAEARRNSEKREKIPNSWL